MRQLAAVALMAAFVASGCGIVGRQLTQRGVPDQPGDPSRVGPAVVIGGAADAAGTWRAWVYRTNDGSICLSIESNENGSSGCSSDLEGITGMGRSSGGSFDYVSGGSLKPLATTASIRFADGKTATVPLVAIVAIQPGARFFAARLPPSSEVSGIDILDAAGNVLETLANPFDDPVKVPPPAASPS